MYNYQAPDVCWPTLAGGTSVQAKETFEAGVPKLPNLLSLD